MKKKLFAILSTLMIITMSLCACEINAPTTQITTEIEPTTQSAIEDNDLATGAADVIEPVITYNSTIKADLTGIKWPEPNIDADCEPYAEINNNIPLFTDYNYLDGFEYYSELDELGRPGTAIALVSRITMPPEGSERGEIGQIKPPGWHTIKYPELIDDLYLYNRCHLIGWQLTAENANERNLITGTRYLNVTGMLPFENKIADYVKTTDDSVLYRVTPIYENDDLVCKGLLLEAKSTKTNDCVFCVYCYNIQPGINIDYATGESNPIHISVDSIVDDENSEIIHYVLNTNTMKVHYSWCESVEDIKPENRKDYYESLENAHDMGYVDCKRCIDTK